MAIALEPIGAMVVVRRQGNSSSNLNSVPCFDPQVTPGKPHLGVVCGAVQPLPLSDGEGSKAASTSPQLRVRLWNGESASARATEATGEQGPPRDIDAWARDDEEDTEENFWMADCWFVGAPRAVGKIVRIFGEYAAVLPKGFDGADDALKALEIYPATTLIAVERENMAQDAGVSLLSSAADFSGSKVLDAAAGGTALSVVLQSPSGMVAIVPDALRTSRQAVSASLDASRCTVDQFGGAISIAACTDAMTLLRDANGFLYQDSNGVISAAAAPWKPSESRPAPPLFDIAHVEQTAATTAMLKDVPVTSVAAAGGAHGYIVAMALHQLVYLPAMKNSEALPDLSGPNALKVAAAVAAERTTGSESFLHLCASISGTPDAQVRSALFVRRVMLDLEWGTPSQRAAMLSEKNAAGQTPVIKALAETSLLVAAGLMLVAFELCPDAEARRACLLPEQTGRVAAVDILLGAAGHTPQLSAQLQGAQDKLRQVMLAWILQWDRDSGTQGCTRAALTRLERVTSLNKEPKSAASQRTGRGSIRVGDRVQLASDYRRFSDASAGPLQPGQVGIVINDDDSRHGQVRAPNGDTWFYRYRALTSLSTTPAEARCTPLQTWWACHVARSERVVFSEVFSGDHGVVNELQLDFLMRWMLTVHSSNPDLRPPALNSAVVTFFNTLHSSLDKQRDDALTAAMSSLVRVFALTCCHPDSPAPAANAFDDTLSSNGALSGPPPPGTEGASSNGSIALQCRHPSSGDVMAANSNLLSDEELQVAMTSPVEWLHNHSRVIIEAEATGKKGTRTSAEGEASAAGHSRGGSVTAAA